MGDLEDKFIQRAQKALETFSRRNAGELVSLDQKRRRSKPRKPGALSEHGEQCIVVDWLKAHHLVYAAVPNGAALAGGKVARARQMKRLKAEGLRKGFPDIVVFSPPPKSSAPGVILEMKRDRAGRLSLEQRQWLDVLRGLGWIVLVGWGSDDAIKKLKGLGYGGKA